MLGSSKATELLSEIYPVENPHRTCAQHSQLPQILGENNSLKNIMNHDTNLIFKQYLKSSGEIYSSDLLGGNEGGSGESGR